MRVMLIAVVSMFALSANSVFGQQAGGAAPGQMKSALLVPNGFTAEGNCRTKILVFDLVFREQGNKVFAKMTSAKGSCDNEVRLSGDSLEFEGCGGYPNRIVYDPSDAKWPLKGAAAGRLPCTYALRPK